LILITMKLLWSVLLIISVTLSCPYSVLESEQ
jgi:hypothetical protein